MPNDAKLGLVVGVGIIIALGVIYRHNPSSGDLAHMRPSRPTLTSTKNGSGSSQSPYRLTGNSPSLDMSPSDGPPMPPADDGHP